MVLDSEVLSALEQFNLDSPTKRKLIKVLEKASKASNNDNVLRKQSADSKFYGLDLAGREILFNKVPEGNFSARTPVKGRPPTRNLILKEYTLRDYKAGKIFRYYYKLLNTDSGEVVKVEDLFGSSRIKPISSSRQHGEQYNDRYYKELENLDYTDPEKVEQIFGKPDFDVNAFVNGYLVRNDIKTAHRFHKFLEEIVSSEEARIKQRIFENYKHYYRIANTMIEIEDNLLNLRDVFKKLERTKEVPENETSLDEIFTAFQTLQKYESYKSNERINKRISILSEASVQLDNLIKLNDFKAAIKFILKYQAILDSEFKKDEISKKAFQSLSQRLRAQKKDLVDLIINSASTSLISSKFSSDFIGDLSNLAHLGMNKVAVDTFFSISQQNIISSANSIYKPSEDISEYLNLITKTFVRGVERTYANYMKYVKQWIKDANDDLALIEWLDETGSIFLSDYLFDNISNIQNLIYVRQYLTSVRMITDSILRENKFLQLFFVNLFNLEFPKIIAQSIKNYRKSIQSFVNTAIENENWKLITSRKFNHIKILKSSRVFYNEMIAFVQGAVPIVNVNTIDYFIDAFIKVFEHYLTIHKQQYVTQYLEGKPATTSKNVNILISCYNITYVVLPEISKTVRSEWNIGTRNQKFENFLRFEIPEKFSTKIAAEFTNVTLACTLLDAKTLERLRRDYTIEVEGGEKVSLKEGLSMFIKKPSDNVLDIARKFIHSQRVIKKTKLPIAPVLVSNLAYTLISSIKTIIVDHYGKGGGGKMTLWGLQQAILDFKYLKFETEDVMPSQIPNLITESIKSVVLMYCDTASRRIEDSLLPAKQYSRVIAKWLSDTGKN